MNSEAELDGKGGREEREKESERPGDLLESVRTISSRAAPTPQLWFPIRPSCDAGLHDQLEKSEQLLRKHPLQRAVAISWG